MSAELLIAHRGHASECPENTLSAVESALRAGARAVEIDVQLSADREPFLMHDRTLERICGVASPLGAVDSARVRELRASERGRFGMRFADERVASLAEFTARIARAEGVHAYVEIKRASTEQFGVDAVLDAVLPLLLPIRKRCTLISFDVDVLHATRSRTELPVGPVLIAWDQRTSAEIVSLAPSVVFCDVDKLPAEGGASGELDVPGGALAVYEIDRLDVALSLLRRGARFLETFEVGRLLRELDEHDREHRAR